VLASFQRGAVTPRTSAVGADLDDHRSAEDAYVVLPGDGPTSGISVTLTAGTLQAIRERVGKRGVSAYLEKAAQRQIERDNLDELIADFDKVHGPADPEAVAAKRARLTGGGSRAGAAA
jgi:hypothetical protein